MKKAFPETAIPNKTFLDLNPSIFNKGEPTTKKLPVGEGWFSVLDYSYHHKCSNSTARRRLFLLQAEGTLEEKHFLSKNGNSAIYYRQKNN